MSRYSLADVWAAIGIATKLKTLQFMELNGQLTWFSFLYESKSNINKLSSATLPDRQSHTCFTFSTVILIDKIHEFDTVALNATQLQHHKLKPRDGCLKPPKVKFEKSVAGSGIYRASRVFVYTALRGVFLICWHGWFFIICHPLSTNLFDLPIKTHLICQNDQDCLAI